MTIRVAQSYGKCCGVHKIRYFLKSGSVATSVRETASRPPSIPEEEWKRKPSPRVGIFWIAASSRSGIRPSHNPRALHSYCRPPPEW
ncbi:uncharacterized protein MYCFIDRAFT_176020 [Pseudocercospora fijiensis CIRAD86]|uniref:Uncharacterized protein n=1 Tax=Pseudocercospora fijiensis (strain CIRAD86) TaxID=383855 RepID=M2ZTZ5_PSEFD|nr:uncharacterized protein MYCFIDRAFT_176020 [Pseudocercospora fijiensis CIRAD86]EME82474.1 hypothetical protein MYCFIDRAFT_176020 [Pseudocercospora fijiensis CIRAD86]